MGIVRIVGHMTGVAAVELFLGLDLTKILSGDRSEILIAVHGLHPT